MLQNASRPLAPSPPPPPPPLQEGLVTHRDEQVTFGARGQSADPAIKRAQDTSGDPPLPSGCRALGQARGGGGEPRTGTRRGSRGGCGARRAVLLQGPCRGRGRPASSTQRQRRTAVWGSQGWGGIAAFPSARRPSPGLHAGDKGGGARGHPEPLRSTPPRPRAPGSAQASEPSVAARGASLRVGGPGERGTPASRAWGRRRAGLTHLGGRQAPPGLHGEGDPPGPRSSSRRRSLPGGPRSPRERWRGRRPPSPPASRAPLAGSAAKAAAAPGRQRPLAGPGGSARHCGTAGEAVRSLTHPRPATSGSHAHTGAQRGARRLLGAARKWQRVGAVRIGRSVLHASESQPGTPYAARTQRTWQARGAHGAQTRGHPLKGSPRGGKNRAVPHKSGLRTTMAKWRVRGEPLLCAHALTGASLRPSGKPSLQRLARVCALCPGVRRGRTAPGPRARLRLEPPPSAGRSLRARSRASLTASRLSRVPPRSRPTANASRRGAASQKRLSRAEGTAGGLGFSACFLRCREPPWANRGLLAHPAGNQKEALSDYSLILVERCTFQAENTRYSPLTESSVHGQGAEEIKNANRIW